MISPVVVRVALNRHRRGQDKLTVSLEAPMIGDQSGYDFRCDISDQVFAQLANSVPTANSVRAAGELLGEGLRNNPDVGTAFQQALLATSADRFPLLLELRGNDTVESLPWETLYLPDAGFLGLDPRWSVGRRVDSGEVRPYEGVLPGSLQIAVVLSCLGISARDEWLQLKAAMEQSPLPVEMLIFVGEPDLAEALAKDCPAWLRVTGIPANAETLAARLRQEAREGFAPQVLHFFCHGSNDGGAHLEIATPSDWERDATQSSLTLEPSQVRDLTDAVRRPWLVVLNSCLGAAPLTDDSGAGSPGQSRARQRAATHSLARKLVREGGFPAVIGMREPIDRTDATVFSSRLYPQLLQALDELPTDHPTALDWSRLLVSARRSLAEQPGTVFSTAAGDSKRWTLPVLYVRSQELLISRAAPRPAPAVEDSTTAHAPIVLGSLAVGHRRGTGNGRNGADKAPETAALPASVPPTDPAIAATIDLLREVLASLGPDAPSAYLADLEAHIARLEMGEP